MGRQGHLTFWGKEEERPSTTLEGQLGRCLLIGGPVSQAGQAEERRQVERSQAAWECGEVKAAFLTGPWTGWGGGDIQRCGQCGNRGLHQDSSWGFSLSYKE